ncbi:MAG: ATP-dependent DNA helicase RecG, partial [Sphingobacteriia bacterium]|nr:ATP-dependent DNA helicase RecG [Sphingobacteriia bacterium]
LLTYYPIRYIDRSEIGTIQEITPEMTYVSLKGKITHLELVGKAGRGRRLVGVFADSTGTLELVWFQGIKWVSEQIKIGEEIILHGRLSWFLSKPQFAHPEIEKINSSTGENTGKRWLPVYSSTEKLKKVGLDARGFRVLIEQIIAFMPPEIPDNLPISWVTETGFISRREAWCQIHQPDSLSQIQRAQYRLKFEELFFFQLMLASYQKGNKQRNRSYPFLKVGDLFNTYYHHHLPFELTGAQKRVMKEIRMDLAKPVQMNRLIQGDVGSGKTMVAFLSILIALDNSTQAAFMAPTEILADQHYRNILKYSEPLGIGVELLTGKVPAKARKILLEKLATGESQILIGTHAILEDPVVFQNLGLTIIDEQHKFGVAQRARLWSKGKLFPHNMVMTATPIPRTLAMTVYGDLEVSVIDELPPGRKPVRTKVVRTSKRPEVYSFVRQQLSEGRQIYIVYPLVAESEKSDLQAATEGWEYIQGVFPEVKVGLVYGKLKPLEKENEMQRFKSGETRILVSTTVIEVGVDVPNSTVMIIENAERFGLSQLHQLRGRVGRGGNQSYCILIVSDKISKEGRKRLAMMEETQDGFKIAEADLEIRGPGDFMGTRQSGLPEFKIASISEDG